MKSFKKFFKEDPETENKLQRMRSDIASQPLPSTPGLKDDPSSFLSPMPRTGGMAAPAVPPTPSYSSLQKSWKPLQGDELNREFHPHGGEIASQLKGHDLATAAKSRGESHVDLPGGTKAPVKDMMLHSETEKALRALHNNPDHLQKELQKPREIWNKQRIRDENVLNTTGGQSWDKVKQGLEAEKVARAEKNRTGPQTSPTIVKITHPETGKTIYHNTGGNTRLSSMHDDGHALAHVIDATPLVYPKK